MTSGERRVGVNFSPSRNTMVDTIKRKAADLIDHINGLETADFNEPGEVARLKVLAMTDIESAAHWAVKAATRLGGRVTRLVTTLQQFCDLVGWLRLRRWSQAIERVAEVERAAQATAPAGERMTTDEVAKALIDGGVRPQGTPRRCIRQLRLWVGRDGELARGAPIARRLAAPAPRVEAPHSAPRPLHGAPRRRPPTPSPRHAASVEAPPSAARWRPSAAPPCSRPTSVPKRPPPIAQPQHPRICASRPPQSPPAPNSSTARHAPKTALDGAKSAPHALLAASTHTTARRARHARGAQRAPQHRCLGYNILWPRLCIIAKSN